jgi:dTDP-4-dehydrorhamnose 3,5-epimerase
MIQGVKVSPLKIIDVNGGNVLHAMKATDSGYCGFGEAYFSKIENKVVKGWKRHKEMTLKILVPIGSIRFVLYDSRNFSSTYGHFYEIILSNNNYNRITVPPMIWMGFQGLETGFSMLLNLADMPHNKAEVEEKELNKIKYDWRIN